MAKTFRSASASARLSGVRAASRGLSSPGAALRRRRGELSTVIGQLSPDLTVVCASTVCWVLPPWRNTALLQRNRRCASGAPAWRSGLLDVHVDREGWQAAVEPGIAILSSLPAWQRVVVVGLAIIPLILVT